MRPGDRLRAFAAHWCGAETMTTVIDPLIADLQHEHAVAVRAGHVWRGWTLRVAAGVAFLRVLAICALAEAQPSRWSDADRKTIAWSLAVSAVVIVALTGLFVIPPMLTTLSGSPHAFRWWMVLALIPQALPIGLAIGTTVGILVGVRGRALPRSVSSALVVASLVVSAGSFVNLAWVVPSANQAFRAGVSGINDLQRGIPELTLGEVRQELWRVDHGPRPLPINYGTFPPFASNTDGYARALGFNYHSRWALSCSPVIFAVFALAVAGLSRKRWVLGSAASAAFVGYYWLAFGGRSLALTGDAAAAVAAWVPNAVVAFAAAIVVARRWLMSLLTLAVVLACVPPPASARTTDLGYDAALSPSLSAVAKTMHEAVRRNLMEAANVMPAREYAFRPSPQVRTFAQLVGHVINANPQATSPTVRSTTAISSSS